MADLVVNGGNPLSGTITPSGNKNAVLPILCATLLTDEPVALTNVPDITDLDKLVSFFTSQGSRIDWDRGAGVMRVDHSSFRNALSNAELPQDMRSTVLLYPALLHRMGRIALRSNAKGCSLGVREIDPHLEVLAALGAAVDDGDPLSISIDGGFRAARHWLDYMSVTVTENFAMAAAVARGTRSEEHTSELQSLRHLVCRLLLEKKKN